jgi:DNA polymerase III psi subunit
MSTATTERVGFGKPPIEEKPDHICAGRVAEVKDAYLGKSENSYVVPIKLEPLGSGKAQTIFLLFRPEWFRQHSAADYRRMEEDAPQVYRKFKEHMYCNPEDSGYKPSHLQGLAVTAEKFEELADRLIRVGEEAIASDPTLVSNVLREFLVEENGDTVIGYQLTQQREKSDMINEETGKAIYVPTKWWEVRSYWTVNEKSISRNAEKAEKQPRRYKMCYAGESF